ncbi:hypothetical protein [Aeromicrobium sp. Leaf350]|uniref:hypothetical protein n=1 Tax=Aeromicrobium sp. Leaf350 TaxID=2876565 RepID=UPI001E3E27DE|nr:hypothetical protein [Aeromicrobium sp. Leaf350]
MVTLGVLTSLVIHTLVSFRNLLTAEPGPLRSLHTLGMHDQLGYLAIVANVAEGDLSLREPVTETGNNFYPRSYYTFLGLVARATGWHPVTTWNVVTLVVQLVAIAIVALALVRLSGRSWAAFLAPLPVLLGTMGWLVGEDGWYTRYDSHAILWGPFAAISVGNAGAAGLCVMMAAIAVLAAIWMRPTPSRTRWVVTGATAVALGLLSGVQTYTFLEVAYLSAYVTAVAVLLRHGTRAWWIASGVLLVVVLATGGLVADISPLASLVAGLGAAAPGLVKGALVSRGRLVICAALFTLAASPQLLWTIHGIRTEDPFLTYRVASTQDLGVIRWETLLASLPAALPLVVVIVLAVRTRHRDLIALSSVAFVVAILLSTNEVWGPNQEPYRFWLDLYLVMGVVALVGWASILGERSRAADPEPELEADPEADAAPVLAASGPLAPRAVSGRTLVASGLLCVAVFLAAAPDVVNFVRDDLTTDTYNPQTPREEALGELARLTQEIEPGTMTTADSCIDLRKVKVSSAVPIAYYYLGMAWPIDKGALDSVVLSIPVFEEMNLQAMAATNTRWVLTDSRCDATFSTGDGHLEAVETRPYESTEGSGTITLSLYVGDIAP